MARRSNSPSDSETGNILTAIRSSWATTVKESPNSSVTMQLDVNVDEKPFRTLNKAIAEFIGVALFVFVGSLSMLNSNAENITIHGALTHGLAIFVLISVFGHISGGHFNPAVTLSVALAERLSWPLAIIYWIAQFLGGFSGAFLVRTVLSHFRYVEILGGATTVAKTASWYQCLTTEAVLTMILCLAVLSLAADGATNHLASLAIGMSITVNAFAGNSISGASMNPARSLPSALAFLLLNGSNEEDALQWEMQYVYLAGPFIGAFLAAVLFRFVDPRASSFVLAVA